MKSFSSFLQQQHESNVHLLNYYDKCKIIFI